MIKFFKFLFLTKPNLYKFKHLKKCYQVEPLLKTKASIDKQDNIYFLISLNTSGEKVLYLLTTLSF